MRHLPALVLLASLAATLEAAAFDHYDPIALDASATAAMQDGDWGTARILLERAALLAPHDGRLQRKLQQLKAWQEGAPASGATEAGPTTESRGDARVPPAPPPIWPAK